MLGKTKHTQNVTMSTYILFELSLHTNKRSVEMKLFKNEFNSKIYEFYKFSDNLLKCPGCQQSYHVNSPNFLENLPSNLYIDNLLKLLISSPTSVQPLERTVSLFAKPEPETIAQKRCCKCQSGISLFSDHCCEHCKQVILTKFSIYNILLLYIG